MKATDKQWERERQRVGYCDCVRTSRCKGESVYIECCPQKAQFIVPLDEMNCTGLDVRAPLLAEEHNGVSEDIMLYLCLIMRTACLPCLVESCCSHSRTKRRQGCLGKSALLKPSTVGIR